MARSIRLGEWDAEDAEQTLSARKWPEEGAGRKGWRRSVGNGSYSRIVKKPEDFHDNWEGELETLREQVLRFPSAPIHGLHRLSQEHVNMGPVESFHTFRILSHPDRRGKVKRIFLLHNGLNETQKMGLYYRLAFFLIDQDKDSICILRPFPGHLTRSASIGLAETPLDHYLWDGLHLFRQFLRYMIETRWLLSSIVRYSTYRCVSGSGLLGERVELDKSRLDPKTLGDAIAAEWTDLYEASKKAIEKQDGGSPQMPKKVPHKDAFKQAVTSLRDVLRLDQYDPVDGISYENNSEPELHVIGYSLGGFAAQSVFMSWPFLVSSCSTLLSGGALRELSPTAFADPEEWQTVLHSLRYELDDAMLDWRFTPPKECPEDREEEDPRVAGIDPNLFLFLKRTFYEVFEQEYRGSFQTRLVAFRQRMLFIVGGNDPIVRPQSVLDAGPPDGINLIAIGGLGHFLESSPKGRSEKEQRLFWLPEIGRTIGKLADKAATEHRKGLAETWLDENYLVPEPKTAKDQDQEGEQVEGREQEQEKPEESEDAAATVERLTIAERLAVAKNGSLPSRIFQRSLDDLLARVVEQPSEGLLFILKNEAPTFLLDPRALQQHAAALYHEDVGIVKHVREVRSRIPAITKARKRICVVLPWNIETVTRYIDAGLQHPSQSESSGEQMIEVPNSEETWDNLKDTCMEWTKGEHEDSIRVFDGRDGVDAALGAREEIGKLSAAARVFLGIDKLDEPIKPALPDCWVWMSNEFLGLSKLETPSIDEGRSRLCKRIPELLDRGEEGEKSAEVEANIAEHLRKDDLRMVTISRARYNPRYRGRIIVEPRPAQELLLRVALCIAASAPFGDYFKSSSPRRRQVPSV